jgi:hypothetical protein
MQFVVLDLILRSIVYFGGYLSSTRLLRVQAKIALFLPVGICKVMPARHYVRIYQGM